MSNKILYEILIPTKYGNNLKPISTKHHKSWDKWVRSKSGGLTILSPSRGQWVDKSTLYEERVIPVRIMTTEKIMTQVVKFTKSHYRQRAVMFFILSRECYIYE